ncbi:S-layer homology domain-containing protein [Paenibacillus paeoniae]|uniref:S-layer homology domain-containing protein n=2 Tax=Paenibacillus paeoniae TaxID=2292705 RepID=A0A371P8V1_9BACL|nr:S-layer homology domain-containing protein [Paenibacillus paeoniae]
MPNGKQSVQIQLKDNGFEELIKNEDFKNSKIFEITSRDSAERYEVTVPIKSLSSMKSLEVSSSLRISTPKGSWQLSISALLKELNLTSSDPVVISIENAGEEYEEILKKQLAGSGLQPLGSLLDFSVTVNKKPFNQYSEYAEHELIIETKQIPLNQLAGLTYDPVTKKFVPVPIKAEWKDGILHVSLFKKGNSVYTVVRTGKTSFKDVAANSMYKESIEALTNRLVMEGFVDGTFKPEKSITRAEFAAILNRSLGILPGSDKSASQFKDVKKGAWYEKDVNASVSAGLITGYSPTIFKPDQTITHQEMIVMLVRAYEYVRTDSLKAASIAAPAALKLPEWFIPTYEKAVQEGILLGTDAFKFQPTQMATRQESAYLMHRLLKVLEFI